jgi:hypothetical protein
MADERPKKWRSIPGAQPLNDARGITYQRIMDAEIALYPRHERLRAPESLLGDILDTHEPETDAPVEDLYLATLSEYVAALGGHVEIRAIFPDEQVRLLREPDPTAGPPHPLSP